ncbi:T9SS type A sorting domain-containing protein, partial [candidate division WOR-3 bacterium]|nr:T9SS type A sorting domain-containing protein [candidate division WOR-3 bacterium]
ASSANDTVRQTPNIVTQKYQTYPSNYVYALYTQGSSQRVYYNYSTDGGENWQTPGIWSISGDNVSYLPNMTLGWDQTIDRPVACCNVPGTGYDTLVVAMMESNFTTWYLRAAVNDHDKTTSMPAKITYGTVSPINGRIVIYREFASNNIWFDRWNHMNQVEETPDDLPFSNGFNVFRSSAGFNICFSTALDQNIRIEIFDVLGRNVVTIADQIFSAGEHTAEWNMTGKSGEKVVSGTYFISITTQTEKATKAIQLF